MGKSLFNKVVDCRPATVLNETPREVPMKSANFFKQLLL